MAQPAAHKLPALTWRDLQVHANGDLPFQIAHRIRQAGIVGVDIETVGTPERQEDALDFARGQIKTITFYAPDSELSLVRIFPGVTPHWVNALFWDRNLVKIFHHAMFDLRFCIAKWSSAPENIVCTKIAAKLLNIPHAEQSLAPLTDRFLGVKLPKGQALSDWGAETLEEAQLQYAANDVLYLPSLYTILENQLRGRGLLQPYQQACAWLPSCASLEVRGVTPSTLFEY